MVAIKDRLYIACYNAVEKRIVIVAHSETLLQNDEFFKFLFYSYASIFVFSFLKSMHVIGNLRIYFASLKHKLLNLAACTALNVMTKQLKYRLIGNQHDNTKKETVNCKRKVSLDIKIKRSAMGRSCEEWSGASPLAEVEAKYSHIRHECH